jgi:hypothetical protein
VTSSQEGTVHTPDSLIESICKEGGTEIWKWKVAVTHVNERESFCSQNVCMWWGVLGRRLLQMAGKAFLSIS